MSLPQNGGYPGAAPDPRYRMAWVAGILGALVLLGDLLGTMVFTVLPPLLARSIGSSGAISAVSTGFNVLQVLFGATVVVLGLVALRTARGPARAAAAAGAACGAVVAGITLFGLIGWGIELALLRFA